MVNHYQIERQSMSYPLGVYIDKTYEGINYITDQFLEKAKLDIEKNTRINIVCRGSSGSIMATILFTKLKMLNIFEIPKIIRICHIKKEGENAHSSSISSWEDDNEFEKPLYVWIDDFIDSGNTFEKSLDRMRKHLKSETFEFDWTVCATGFNLRNFEGKTKNLVMYAHEKD